jgi:large subunit ribosomal protein L19
MASVIEQIEARYKKKAVVDAKSGDTVKVHQKIREGGKERVQIFEGLVIKTARKNSHTSSFTVRRIASGIGVEKTFLMHSPNILKVEVTKRAKVRRNYLSYMRQLTGKNARLMGVDFDRDKVNVIHDEEAEAEEAKIKEEQEKSYDPEAAKAEKEAEKAEAATANAETPKSEADNPLASGEEKPKEKAAAAAPAQEQNKA